MKRTQTYFRKKKLDALNKTAVRSDPGAREPIHEAVRKPQLADPIAIWGGEPKRRSIEHDSAHDEP